MTQECPLKAAIALIEKPDGTSSAEIIAASNALDIRGARHAVELVQGKHDSMLLRATDAAMAKVEAELHTANRELARRLAAEKALAPLIVAAKEREAKAEIESAGKAARLARLRAVQAYVALDEAARGVVDLLDAICREEAAIAEANLRFREVGRSDLLVGLPMNELALLAGVDGEHLPRLSWWRLHGYTNNSAERPADPDFRPIVPERRFGRLAELLPGATPAPETVPASEPVSTAVRDRHFVPAV